MAQKIHDLASGIGIKNVWAVMNKVPSQEISTRLNTELQKRRIEVVGCIYFDADIFSSSLEGRIPVKGVAVRETREIMDNVLSKAGLPTLG